MLYIYILNDPDKENKCKVGITKNLDQRLKSYRTACPQCVYFYTREIDKKIHEKRILDIIKDTFYIDREYVHCNPKMIENIIVGYFDDC